MKDTIVGIKHNRDGNPESFIVLTFEYTKEEGMWVGVCLELGTSTFADSVEQVREELLEAVSLQISEMTRLGYGDQYFRENNVPIRPIPQPISEPGFSLAGMM